MAARCDTNRLVVALKSCLEAETTHAFLRVLELLALPLVSNLLLSVTPGELLIQILQKLTKMFTFRKITRSSLNRF